MGLVAIKMTEKSTIKFAVEESLQRSNKFLLSTSGRNPKTPENTELAVISQNQIESCCKLLGDTFCGSLLSTQIISSEQRF